jgi:hypothetical protein
MFVKSSISSNLFEKSNILFICFSNLYFDDKPDTDLPIYIYVHSYMDMVDNKIHRLHTFK